MLRRQPALSCRQLRGLDSKRAIRRAALKPPIRRIPLVLATLVALRALVPVGYMLSLPSGGSFDLALHLCPTQNPTIDLTQLLAIGGSGTMHHGHAGDVSVGAGSDTAIAVSPDCDAWLGSAALAVATHPPTLELARKPVLPLDDINDARARVTRSYSTLPRAPPDLLA